MDDPLHLMIISDSPFSGTGFSEELRHILYRLVQTGLFRISWYGLQYTGFPIYIPDSMFPDIPHTGATIKLLGTRGSASPYSLGADSNFVKHYFNENPEAVLFMGDPLTIEPYKRFKENLGFPLYMYVTLDGLPVNEKWLPLLNMVNVLITMTEWAQEEYVKVGLAPAFIHHGLNWSWWRSPNEQIKSQLRNKYKIPEDDTVFISWDVNQHRKRMDSLLRCWSKFRPESKNAKLLLYTGWNMPQGYNLKRLIKQYKIPPETVISPEQLQENPKYVDCAETPERLREIAFLGDVYVSTTSGEGFGKCSLEAMGAGMPVIITDYAASSEVCAKGSILVPTYEGDAGRFRYPEYMRGVDLGIVNEEKFTEAMLELYGDAEERRKLGFIARDWARNFDYDKVIVPKWSSILNLVNPDEILLAELMGLGEKKVLRRVKGEE